MKLFAAAVGVAVSLTAAAVVVGTVSVPVRARSSDQAPAQARRTADTHWQAERAQQLRLVIDRARAITKDIQRKIEIGTMAQDDLSRSESGLADVEALVEADARRTARPAKTAPQIATLRQQVAQALTNLDASEIRFDNGMITTTEMNQAIAGVVKVLIGG